MKTDICAILVDYSEYKTVRRLFAIYYIRYLSSYKYIEKNSHISIIYNNGNKLNKKGNIFDYYKCKYEIDNHGVKISLYRGEHMITMDYCNHDIQIIINSNNVSEYSYSMNSEYYIMS